MATVRMPNSWAVRNTRMAISLRLATRSLRMRRGTAAGDSGMVNGLKECGSPRTRSAGVSDHHLIERVQKKGDRTFEFRGPVPFLLDARIDAASDRVRIG